MVFRRSSNISNEYFYSYLAENEFAGQIQPVFQKQHLNLEYRTQMRTLMASSTVLITIICSLIFGIACGYAVISSILRAFSHQSEKTQAASATAVIAASSSH
jgi:hypothetical protein